MKPALPAMASLLALAGSAGCQAEAERKPAKVAATAAGDAPAASVSPVSGLPIVPLEIRSGGSVHRFSVEVARSPQEQAYGLMNRQRLGPDEGMIFPFQPPRPASFWMKNTLIPLDLIFIRADGSIARIATAPAQSLDHVEVSEPVAAVLEIPGGRAAALGITSAARVAWSGGPRP